VHSYKMELTQTKAQRILSTPFAVDEDIRKAIPDNLELATIFRLAEKGKRKTLFSLRDLEKIEFVVRSYYDIWVVKTNYGVAYLDPLGANTTTIDLIEYPTVEEFIRQLEGSQVSLETFLNFLTIHQDLFLNPAGRKKEIKGLLNREMVAGLTGFVEAVGMSDVAIQSNIPLWDETIGEDPGKIRLLLDEASNVLEAELDRISHALSMLDRTSQHYVTAKRAEMAEIDSEYSKQISATREMVEIAVQELRRRRDAETNIVTSRFTEAKDTLNSELNYYHRLRGFLIREKEVIGMIGSGIRGTNPKKTRKLWKQISGSIPKRLSEIDSEMKKIRGLISAVEEDKAMALSSIESAYEDLTKSKRKTVVDIEVEKEIELRKKKEDVEELVNKTSQLRNQIIGAIEKVRKEVSSPSWLSGSDSLTLERSVFRIPFYLICYRGIGGRIRYTAIPPSQFKGAYSTLTLGFKMLEERLKPFSKDLTTFFEEKLVFKLNSDAFLKHEIYKRGKAQDLLSSQRERAKILEGLELVYNKGWLHFSSVMSLKKSLKKYSR